MFIFIYIILKGWINLNLFNAHDFLDLFSGWYTAKRDLIYMPNS